MSVTDIAALKEIFGRALEIEDADQRRAYLDDICVEQPELRQQVDRLLGSLDRAEEFMASPDDGVAATLVVPQIAEGPGFVIGPYKLLEEIGRGGMGIVYMAEQVEPVRRKVALKIIKPGMDTQDVIARFEAERQALAMMGHPNIARILDAGATESGRPYFVMELVRGIPITDYCEQNKLPTRERLRLFASVCHGVQHAHQKGIIHRDLKPTNVLVTLHDDRPVPKVIDFGVAKATMQPLTERTLFTRFAQIVGTPLYMSPEQTHISGLDVDIRSDVYSLGVLLYELMTGTTPFDRKRIHEAAYDELIRIIREEEPPRPSVRLSTISVMADSNSSSSRPDPGQLSRFLRGELDWIVMKALEKDRTCRYDTANGLAEDVQRYLEDEPVHAFPPSAWYRFKKFARRNKVALAMTTVVCLALLVTVAGVAASIGWAVRNRKAIEEQAARERAAHSHFREGLVQQNVGDLDAAIQAFRKASELNPDDAAAWNNLGHVLLDKGDLAGAVEQFVRAIALEPQQVAHRNSLAGVLLDQNDLEGTIRQSQAVIEFDPENAIAHANYARALNRQGDLNGAIGVYEQAIRLNPDGVAPRVNLGLLLLDDKRDLQGAIREFQQAIELAPHNYLAQRHLGDALRVTGDHEGAIDAYRTAIALRSDGGGPHNNLGLSLRAVGNLDEAVRAFRKAIEFDSAHAIAYDNLGRVLSDKEDWEQSILAARRAIALEPQNVAFHQALAWTLLQKGDLPEAIDEYRRAIELDPEDARSHLNLGLAHVRAGELQLAIQDYHRSLELRPQYALAHRNLAVALRSTGDLDGAIREQELAVQLDPDYLWGYYQLGEVLIDAGRYAEAADHLNEAISLGLYDARLWGNLARCHLALGNAEEYEAAGRSMRERLPDPEQRSIADWGHFGQALYRAGHYKEALDTLQTGIDLRKEDGPSLKDGPRWWYYTMTLHQLGRTEQARMHFDILSELCADNSTGADAWLHAEAAELLNVELNPKE